MNSQKKFGTRPTRTASKLSAFKLGFWNREVGRNSSFSCVKYFSAFPTMCHFPVKKLHFSFLNGMNWTVLLKKEEHEFHQNLYLTQNRIFKITQPSYQSLISKVDKKRELFSICKIVVCVNPFSHVFPSFWQEWWYKRDDFKVILNQVLPVPSSLA